MYNYEVDISLRYYKAEKKILQKSGFQTYEDFNFEMSEIWTSPGFNVLLYIQVNFCFYVEELEY